MTDEDAIRALQTGYCACFDARDEEGYAALYTEDALVVAPWGQEIRGHDKLKKAVRHTPAGGWHRALATEVVVTGDTATGVCRFEACDREGTVDTGRYEDHYIRTATGWRIATRKVVVESRDLRGWRPA